MPHLSDDFTFMYNSFTWGVGTDYGVLKMSGFSSGAFKLDEVVIPGADGSWFTALYRSAKKPSFILDYHGTAIFNDVLGTLEGALGPQTTELPLYFQLPVLGNKYINCRPIEIDYDIDPPFGWSYTEALAIFFASEDGTFHDDT